MQVGGEEGRNSIKPRQDMVFLELKAGYPPHMSILETVELIVRANLERVRRLGPTIADGL